MSSEAPVPWCTVAIEETTCRALGVLARARGLSYNEVIKMLVAEHQNRIDLHMETPLE